MSEATKIWLITAASLVLTGCIICGVVMTMLGWDFTKLSTDRYETNKHETDENFSEISINTDTADILFTPSENEKCSVICYESQNAKHAIEVKDGTLSINVVNTKKWYEYIGINFGHSKITVCLPEKEYSSLIIKESTGDIEIPNDFKFEDIDISLSTGDVKCYASAIKTIKIKTTTGNIGIDSISADSIDLSVSTGNVTAAGITCEGDIEIGVSTGKTHLTNIVCQSVISSGSTGDISLKNVIAAEKISVKRSTGDVKLEASDAAEIFIETETGDVKGSLLTKKVFIVKTDTGRIDVPNSITGGRCEITTDTGDINITVK